jgi:hypothetical protein
MCRRLDADHSRINMQGAPHRQAVDDIASKRLGSRYFTFKTSPQFSRSREIAFFWSIGHAQEISPITR